MGGFDADGSGRKPKYAYDQLALGDSRAASGPVTVKVPCTAAASYTKSRVNVSPPWMYAELCPPFGDRFRLVELAPLNCSYA